MNTEQTTTVTPYIIAISLSSHMCFAYETEAAVTSEDLLRGHGQDGQF